MLQSVPIPERIINYRYSFSGFIKNTFPNNTFFVR